jgi:hypothetical protein
MNKIVDSYDENGKLLASYPFDLRFMNAPTTDADYIQEAIKCHEEDGISPSLIAKWVVRNPRSDGT